MTWVISINLKLHCPGGLWSSSWHCFVLTGAYHSMVSFSNVMSITTETCFTIGLKGHALVNLTNLMLILYTLVLWVILSIKSEKKWEIDR